MILCCTFFHLLSVLIISMFHWLHAPPFLHMCLHMCCMRLPALPTGWAHDRCEPEDLTYLAGKERYMKKAVGTAFTERGKNI